MTAHTQERHLALRLSAISAADRDWILSRVGAEARRRMSELLVELDELGFRVDEAILADVAARADTVDPVPAGGGSPFDQLLAGIDLADVEDVVEVLQGEPEVLREAVLSVHAWRWQATVRERFASLRAVDGGVRPTGHVQRALLEALAVALEELRRRRPQALPALEDKIGNRDLRRLFGWRR